MDLQTFTTTNAILPFREENRNGRDYLIVNGVPLVEGVLNGRLVQATEFGSFVKDWDGVPVVIRHPKKNNGSARVPEPDVVTVGRFYNAKIDPKGKRLLGEFWIEKDLLLATPEGEAILSQIYGNRPMEVSTGYFSASHAESGEWNSKKYTLIDRNLHPDHIAILPDEVGACSLKDGCGLVRNSAVIQNCEECDCPYKEQAVQMHKPGGKDHDQDNHAGGSSASSSGKSTSWKSVAGTSDDNNNFGLSTFRGEKIPDELMVDSESVRALFPRNVSEKEARYSLEQIAIQNGLPKGTIFEFQQTQGEEDYEKYLLAIMKFNSMKVNVTGSLPAEGKALWEKVYEANKGKYGEERAAKIAWAACKKAGWRKEGDTWMKSNSLSNADLLEGLATLLVVANHYGPGPHKDGSEQKVHGGEGGRSGGGKKFKTTRVKVSKLKSGDFVHGLRSSDGSKMEPQEIEQTSSHR